MIANPGDAQAALYLSEQRIMYIGRLAPNLSLATAASILVVSLEQPIGIELGQDGRISRYTSLLIPAATQVRLHTSQALVALCYLDILGRDLAIIKPRMARNLTLANSQQLYAEIDNEAGIITSASHLYEFSSPAEFAFMQLDSWIGNPPAKSNAPYDPRVEKVLDLIKSSILENRPVQTIANELNLSVPRLSQIFKKVTGIPMRRYRLWQRIFITAVKMAWGMSLTEASISSGFSDSAHFSRVFKEITGVKPSAVLHSKSATLILMLPPMQEIQSRRLQHQPANA